MLEEGYNENIDRIIKELLNINSLLHPNNDEVDIDKVNKEVEKSSIMIDKLFDELELSNEKVELLGFMKYFDKFDNRVNRITIITLGTIIVTSVYAIIDKYTTGNFSIATVFTLLIGTPLTIMMFLNIVDKSETD